MLGLIFYIKLTGYSGMTNFHMNIQLFEFKQWILSCLTKINLFWY